MHLIIASNLHLINSYYCFLSIHCQSKCTLIGYCKQSQGQKFKKFAVAKFFAIEGGMKQIDIITGSYILG